jgi:TATA-box binding protein (TBP) (component of TFIID and TFIIIB)
VDVFGVQGKMVVSNCRTFDDPRRAVQWMQGQLRGLECDD